MEFEKHFIPKKPKFQEDFEGYTKCHKHGRYYKQGAGNSCLDCHCDYIDRLNFFNKKNPYNKQKPI